MNNTETIVLGGGCFWCIEAVIKLIKGITQVIPGYAGGHQANPTYDQVCSGTTGHAEVVQVEFDPKHINLTDILKVFFQTHDPTTLNAQGHDVGTQYRSVIYFTNPLHQTVIDQIITSIQSEYAQPIVTQIEPLAKFWPAEKYHWDYFTNNPDQTYCQAVIQPKIIKTNEIIHQLANK